MESSTTGFLQRMKASFGSTETAPEISIGSRFEQKSHTPAVWVVDRIARPGGSLHDHVTLRREDDPVSTKTLSLNALWSSGDFEAVTQH